MLPHEPTEGSSAKPMFRVAATTKPSKMAGFNFALLLFRYHTMESCGSGDSLCSFSAGTAC
jgi:hypothetical protein